LIFAGLGILISVKFLILMVLGKSFGLKGGQGTLFSFALAQGGEFAFVLISFSLQNSVLTPEISGVLLIVVALSMALTPLLLLINEKFVQPAVEKSTNEVKADEIESSGNPVIIAGFGRFGITVGRLIMANGFKATILDDNPDHIQVLRKFGVKVYYGDASRPDLLHAAGCAEAKVLVIAIDDKEKALQVLDHVTKEYPHLKVIGRAVSKPHAYEYLKRGIEDYDNDMLDSSLESGKRALNSLGFSRYQAHRAAKVFKHHERLFEKEIFQHHGDDEQKYISEARRLSSELEELLQEESKQSIHDWDIAWDVTSRLDEARMIMAEKDNTEE